MLAAGAAAATAVTLAVGPVSGALASSPATHASSAAVTSGTTVWGWGNDGLGQLGRSVPNMFTSTPVRARLPRGTRISSVRAGCFHTVALTSAGHVLAWGGNIDGELGRGTTGGSSHRLSPAVLNEWAGTTLRP